MTKPDEMIENPVSFCISNWTGRPFEYGVVDCCQFVGAVIAARHGHNPMDAFSYRDADGAGDVIDEYGSLEAAVTATLGEPRESVQDSVDGDVLLIEMDDGTQLVGYNDRGLGIALGENGNLAHIRVDACKRAWEP